MLFIVSLLDVFVLLKEQSILPKSYLYMKKLFFVGLWMAILFPLCDCFGKGSHKRVFISDMTCEYLTNPLSVHTSTPRLAWQIVTADSSRRDVEQVAYQIQVASTPEKLLAGKADLWDSGKVKSGQTNQIPYAGNAPAEWGRAWWRVRVWTDLAGASAWSEPAFGERV